jgi:hypothetical protein
MVEMLRDGVHPDTIFAFVKKAYKNTKYWKKYQHCKQKRERKTEAENKFARF